MSATYVRMSYILALGVLFCVLRLAFEELERDRCAAVRNAQYLVTPEKGSGERAARLQRDAI